VIPSATTVMVHLTLWSVHPSVSVHVPNCLTGFFTIFDMLKTEAERSVLLTRNPIATIPIRLIPQTTKTLFLKEKFVLNFLISFLKFIDLQ
jgi:hypothetical protein